MHIYGKGTGCLELRVKFENVYVGCKGFLGVKTLWKSSCLIACQGVENGQTSALGLRMSGLRPVLSGTPTMFRFFFSRPSCVTKRRLCPSATSSYYIESCIS